MRVVFAGTPRAALPCFEALVQSRHEIVAVVTRPDALLGRRRILTPSPVAQAAQRHNVEVIKTARFTTEVNECLAALEPDIGVIVAFGGLVPEALLEVPQFGWVNLHFSLLPRWRGAAPVQHAILAGDEITGATVFSLVKGLDAGPILGTLTTPIGADETAGELLDRLSHESTSLVLSSLEGLQHGSVVARPQLGDVTVAPKIRTEDGHIDWTKPAETVYARIRAVTPEPGAYMNIGPIRVKIHAARLVSGNDQLAPGEVSELRKRVFVGTSTAPIELLTVHQEGKKAMPALHWWNGMGNKKVHAE